MRLIKFFFFFLAFSSAQADTIIETVWGPHTVSNPIIEKLLNNPILLRMKNIDQSGPLPYFKAAPFFSRYEHSVGVLVLLQKAGAPLKEQIAGLFHDVSHTAFSHVGDHLLFESNHEHSYQDKIHLTFLKKMGIENAIKGMMSLDEMDPDRPDYKALERPHPDICADRLQYIIHTGVVLKKITPETAKAMIENVRFNGNDWYFTNLSLAENFTQLSIDFTRDLWGSPWNFIFYECFTKALKRAIDLQLITLDDIQYGTDEKIMQILRQSTDTLIQQDLKVLQNMHNHFITTPFGEGEGKWNVKPKCRAVDPLIETREGLKRLSTLSPLIQKKLDDIRTWCKKGYGVRLINIS